ncbi:hypothetical protein D3P09_25025 [Paenibacillus pinisoli]|uniref:Uncharacterized protein n=1 Tax=Paenibacillus pinisoli TaxID=1276110 RepID=A0A3A6PGF9_9BACL|nr:hypothetical protein [Paenibacillus pinisoli]RJX37169.1 hypothetical protein D3P09_25025 [Paenibacillus pinisoli]
MAVQKKKKKFLYKDYKIDKEILDDEKDFHLEQAYSLCVNELGLQQTKRDQIIAFYIAIISFVIPAIIDLSVATFIKGLSFLALFILGILLTWVVVRYRVYKEVYWITCRVIKQLNNFDKEAINKALVQHMFYRNLKKSMDSVLVTRQAGNEVKVKGWSSYWRNLYSSETILFHIPVLISSVVLWIGMYMLLIDFTLIRYIIPSALTLANLLYFTRHYYKQLAKIYNVVFDGNDDSFNAVFGKAWFLHFHLDFNENKKDSDSLQA